MVNEKEIQEKIEKSIITNKISSIVRENITINDDAHEDLLEKCKGPANGYVDGLRYYKDNQRLFNDNRGGDLEQAQLDKQLSNSTSMSRDDKILFEKMDTLPYDVIGYGLHGEGYSTGNMDTPADEYDGGDYGWGHYPNYDPNDELADAVDLLDNQLQNAPGLVQNTMLFTHDIPNPNLQEGDVFELDTYLGVNFKKKMLNEYDDMWENVDTPYLRENRVEPYNAWYNSKNGNVPYDVTVLGSEGTPILLTSPMTGVDTHTGILNKGQKVRLVRVDHDKHTAVYQTVDG